MFVTGDFNTAHRAIDLARPKTNEATSGFLPIEREEIDRWLELGWVDSFRHKEMFQITIPGGDNGAEHVKTT